MNIKNKIKTIPNKPGVYLFYNKEKELIYVGKATSLKSRVRSYFAGQRTSRPIEEFISQVSNIKFIETDSVLEAIITEANYIKKYQPRYNVLGKDDKSWNYVAFTKEEFPQIKFIREQGIKKSTNLKKEYIEIFGPFPGLNTKSLLKILRNIFQLSTCRPTDTRACFYHQMELCLGVCTGEITGREYKQKVITPILNLFRGRKKQLLKTLKTRMKKFSKEQDFEEAKRLRDQIIALEKIQDITLINKSFVEDDIKLNKDGYSINRIEGYDISNLGETGKVGVMVVFENSNVKKSDYRKFRIRTVKGQSDVDCLKEVISRRLNNNWPLPSLFLIDGGKPQINTVKKVLQEKSLFIPIVGIAKGPTRKKNEFHVINTSDKFKSWLKNNKNLLMQVRDEAHRFAINYQRQTRRIK